MSTDTNGEEEKYDKRNLLEWKTRKARQGLNEKTT
jgi:hypothetical protein